jgi:hypothetical protein
MRFPPTASLSCFHAVGEGQRESEGRHRRKVVLADSRRGNIGSSAADPIAFKIRLLVINRFLGAPGSAPRHIPTRTTNLAQR